MIVACERGHGNSTRGRRSEEPVMATVAGVEPLADPELHQRCTSAGRRRYVERCATRWMAEETIRVHQDTGGGVASAGESGAPTVGRSASAGAGSVSGHCSGGRGTGRSGTAAVTSSGRQR